MIKVGEIQELDVVKITPKGAFLGLKGSDEGAFLPEKEIQEKIKIGDKIEVFVYKDDKLLATTKRPKIVAGEIGFLRVVETTRIGAFLDWGLDKDLFLPFREQFGKIERGEKYLVGVYVDKSNRPCATMQIKRLLSTNSPYKENDKVSGTIYSINFEMGAFVAVDNKYDGLIPQNELYGVYRPGDKVELRVTKVREDGRLYLSLRSKSYKQMDRDANTIINKMKANGGELDLNDASSPRRIQEELNMSKSAFKRAVGRLLKEGKIEFTRRGIKFKTMR